MREPSCFKATQVKRLLGAVSVATHGKFQLFRMSYFRPHDIWKSVWKPDRTIASARNENKNNIRGKAVVRHGNES
jgi:hypothetical protein